MPTDPLRAARHSGDIMLYRAMFGFAPCPATRVRQRGGEGKGEGAITSKTSNSN